MPPVSGPGLRETDDALFARVVGRDLAALQVGHDHCCAVVCEPFRDTQSEPLRRAGHGRGLSVYAIRISMT